MTLAVTENADSAGFRAQLAGLKETAKAVAINLLDRGLLFAYAEIRTNARRLMNLVVALVPLMVLLVGSCKTSELPTAYGGSNNVSQLRMALFPDRPVMAAADKDYTPATGYLKRARKFVQGEPEVLNQLTQQEVTYLFGKPDVERRDANARIWQYKNGGCVVDFYFYTKAGEDAAPVSYVDYRLGGRDQAAESQQGGCLKKIATKSVISSLFS